jgi:hypothetical protein
MDSISRITPHGPSWTGVSGSWCLATIRGPRQGCCTASSRDATSANLS